MGIKSKILVVDDSKFIHVSISNAISEYYDLHFETSGESAINYLEQNTVDLILLDVNMQGMDGYETLKVIRDKNIDTPTIFLTTDSSMESELKALEVGAIDFIAKPFNSEQLKKRADMFLELQQTKRALEDNLRDLKIIEARYRVAAELSDSIIFEYVFEEKTLNCSDSFTKYFNGDTIINNFPECFLDSEFIHPDDIEDFMEFFESLKDGGQHKDTELRLANNNNRYIWCKLRGSAVLDKEGVYRSAIGSISNIDTEKKESQLLLEKAQKDPLTNLLNKTTTQSIIESYMHGANKSANGALMIIDIDNFKSINDNLGHFVGDAVIKDIAEKLKHSFRTTDVVGRIGGDEFLVYMYQIPSEEIVIQKVNSVLMAIRESFLGQNENYSVSASLGLAYFPTDAYTYEELFKKADCTLYAAKRLGKNRYCIYKDIDKDKEQIEENYPLPPRESTAMDEEAQFEEVMETDVVTNIFEIFYESKDIMTSANLIMDVLNSIFPYDRAYAFIESGGTLKKALYWNNSNIKPLEEHHFSGITDKKYYEYFSTYGINNIGFANADPALKAFFDKTDTTHVIQCLIKQGGEPIGYVGFDFCSHIMKLSFQEQTQLAFLAKIIGVYISR